MRTTTANLREIIAVPGDRAIVGLESYLRSALPAGRIPEGN